MNIRTMHFEIVCPIYTDWKKLEKALRDVQYAVWKTYNRTIQMTWDFQQFSFAYRERYGKILKFPDLGTGLKRQKSDIYDLVTGLFPHVATAILDNAILDAQSRFKALRKDILNGTASVPSYKRNIPIPIRAQNIKIEKEGDDYIVTFPLLSHEGAKKYKIPTSIRVKVIAKGAARAIINRLISGEYRLGDSKILRKEKADKTKWFVSLAYKHEVEKPELSPDRVMGVDMGVVNAAVLAYNFSWDRLYLDGSEIRSFRARVEARRNQLLRQYKVAGSRKGHGRVTALKPIKKLRDKAANFRETMNHRYAKKIVEEAVKHGCGVIQMENLSGISTDNRFLESWPYYDLQEKIRYKAEALGIKVLKINPEYTSQRCSRCGHIAECNRPDQATFKCTLCGFKANADYNAARNIATPGIEAIIKRKVDEIKRDLKMAE